MPRQFRTNFTIPVLLSSVLVVFPRLLTADESSSSSSPPPSTTQPAYRTVQQLQSNLTTTPQESVVLCADGKGPLLEGEERIFPCAGQCPAGFECEYVRSRASEGGICCPNLSELYRLYNEESNGEEEGGGEVLDDGQQPDKDGKDQQELGVNAMALLEQHLGKSVVRPRPKVRSVPPDAAAALVSSRPVEIRRSQQRWQQSLSEANIWRPKSQAARQVIGQKDASGEEYSCRRQRLELFCEDGRRHTQFVVRWFAKEGRCLSYPWGYCPGEPVASDRTLRTREECELLCIDPLDAGQDQPVLSVVRFGIGDDKPQQQQQQRELQKPSESFSRQPQPLTQAQQAEKGRDEERESPLAIVGGAPNQEVDPQQHQELVAVEAEPEPIDLSAAQPPGGQSQSESSPPSSASAELADFLLADQRPQPRRKRCEKVTPYRAMCPRDGMPSQFTLRWYQRGQACFAYPYGYCHGESVYEEEPIKTERECLAICVQRRGSVPRRLMAAKSRRRS